LLGISFFLAFGFEYALETRLGSFNVFLFDGVRPFLEAMKNLDYFLASDVQYPIPRPRIAFPQFVNARPDRLNRFPVGRSLPELQPVQSIPEVVPDPVREALQNPLRVALKNNGEQLRGRRRVGEIIGYLVICIHVACMFVNRAKGNGTASPDNLRRTLDETQRKVAGEAESGPKWEEIGARRFWRKFQNERSCWREHDSFPQNS